MCFQLVRQLRWRGVSTLSSRLQPFVPDAKAKLQRWSHLPSSQVPPGPKFVSSLLGTRATPRLPLIWYSESFRFRTVHPFFRYIKIKSINLIPIDLQPISKESRSSSHSKTLLLLEIGYVEE